MNGCPGCRALPALVAALKAEVAKCRGCQGRGWRYYRHGTQRLYWSDCEDCAPARKALADYDGAREVKA